MIAWRREIATRVVNELSTFVEAGWFPYTGRSLLRKLEDALGKGTDPVYVELTEEDAEVLKEILGG